MRTNWKKKSEEIRTHWKGLFDQSQTAVLEIDRERADLRIENSDLKKKVEDLNVKIGCLSKCTSRNVLKRKQLKNKFNLVLDNQK